MSDSPAKKQNPALTVLAREIEEVWTRIQQNEEEGLGLVKRMGTLLLKTKDLMPHGEWVAFIEKCADALSERTAQRYMRVAREWGKLPKATRVSDLTLNGALALLAKPKKIEPDEAVEEPEPVEDDSRSAPRSIGASARTSDASGLRPDDAATDAGKRAATSGRTEATSPRKGPHPSPEFAPRFTACTQATEGFVACLLRARKLLHEACSAIAAADAPALADRRPLYAPVWIEALGIQSHKPGSGPLEEERMQSRSRLLEELISRAQLAAPERECEACDGSGVRTGAKFESPTCVPCAGLGFILHRNRKS